MQNGEIRPSKAKASNNACSRKFNNCRRSSRRSKHGMKKSPRGTLIEHTPVPRQQFSLEQICFVVQHLLLDARTGFRAASRVIESIVQFFHVDWPRKDRPMVKV